MPAGDIYSPAKRKLVFLLEWKAKGLWKYIFMLCTSREDAELMSGVREKIQIYGTGHMMYFTPINVNRSACLSDTGYGIVVKGTNLMVMQASVK